MWKWLLIGWFPGVLLAQKGSLQLEVTDAGNRAIPNATVLLKSLESVKHSSVDGVTFFENLDYGSYDLRISFVGMQSTEITCVVAAPLVKYKVVLKDRDTELSAVEIREKSEGFSSSRIKPVEGVLIAQGKKNEVIQVEDLIASKATNSGRQIYAKIPGLNIWESDGAGIQLGIGGRGLNPSRTANFNTRQSGYDISADALGYPESYYTPTNEAVDRIQLIRGAASLQFGTQFGGLLNFIMKEGGDYRNKILYRQSAGSFGLNNYFLSTDGTLKNTQYYVYLNHKKGDDWRPNSAFKVYTGGFNIKHYFTEFCSIGLEATKMSYLIHQPGGLTDAQFIEDPTVSFRARNWFQVDWNLAAITYNQELGPLTKLNSRFFGLIASRKALGFLGQINRVDPLEERTLIAGDYKNYGNETRLLRSYNVGKQLWTGLVGIRLYEGNSFSKQGLASAGSGADFNFLQNNEVDGSAYFFPSRNVALFAENIFSLTTKFSITPGVRYEWINTSAEGNFREYVYDLAGNIIFDTLFADNRNHTRSFWLGGIGANYKFNDTLEVYANISQNYRSINFTDMQIQNPNFKIDPKLQDEKGYNIDLGIRGVIGSKINYDVSVFALVYQNRIGTTLREDSVWHNTYQYRTNISASLTKGIEALVEVDLWKLWMGDSAQLSCNVFANGSITDARYINSEESAFEGKMVELVPPLSLKSGVQMKYKDFGLSYQFSYTAAHFSDATNAIYSPNAVNGIIPSYLVMDVAVKYKYKWLQFEAGVNNLSNSIYFTRRASGYPGPGILPSPPRNYFITVQIAF